MEGCEGREDVTNDEFGRERLARDVQQTCNEHSLSPSPEDSEGRPSNADGPLRSNFRTNEHVSLSKGSAFDEFGSSPTAGGDSPTKAGLEDFGASSPPAPCSFSVRQTVGSMSTSTGSLEHMAYGHKYGRKKIIITLERPHGTQRVVAEGRALPL
jgi:hypothetical protein